jgi:N-methylhydantoinase B/oxoprolinase/acetone carboxylase alpha subunit
VGSPPRVLSVDPITFEVLRHKLDEIVAEAYHTIGRVSGSPVVYEAGDHQEAICNAGGDLISFGSGALHWVRSISEGVRHVSTELADNPRFEDGDQFLVNDPYIAAVHASDVQVLAPIFAGDRLIAWAGTASHQRDTGGVNPGGHHVDATDVYAEGFQTPGLKLVERGTIRRDVEATFANMVPRPRGVGRGRLRGSGRGAARGRRETVVEAGPCRCAACVDGPVRRLGSGQAGEGFQRALDNDITGVRAAGPAPARRL